MKETSCIKSTCPLFNFESGPFHYSEEELKDISEKHQCPIEIVKACASTNPEGIIEEDTDKYFHICYECTKHGEDYYLDGNGELVCSCPTCWVTKKKEEMNE